MGFRIAEQMGKGNRYLALYSDPTGVGRALSQRVYSRIEVTEGYLRFLEGEGAQRKYGRRKSLFGSLPAEVVERAKQAA